MTRPPAEKRISSIPSCDWGATFPTDLEIEFSSALFAFRLIKVTASFILEKRGVLEENCFKVRPIARLLIPQFNKEVPVAKRLNEKIMALKDAISNRYLREFAIVFYQSPDEEDIVEAYNFRLQYSQDGNVALSIDSGIGPPEFSQNLADAKFDGLDETKRVFVDTVKKLHKCIKILDDFPEGVDASFRVSFTDEAPKDYMPDGFIESPKFYEIGPGMKTMQCGIVASGHHRVQLIAASQLAKKSIDLNVTHASMNQSILAATPAPKKKAVKAAVNRISPYGQTNPLDQKRRNRRVEPV